ncbi:hypothetical protein QX249_10745 [Vibrio parahaemolyticus]|uniref:DUF3168 domain-containing protein n=1 Tax=Vibrio parahaemolyticus TaxID=670 RepID=A0AAW8PYP6_VIBPH|nr:hypothetical protein [Vibrio parahaemolyticus]MDS1821139.1 hypothetical protein [Vibrio parahaemolyticus]
MEQPTFTSMLKKAVLSTFSYINENASLSENIHYPADMLDGWQRRFVLVEQAISTTGRWAISYHVLEKSKFDKDAFLLGLKSVLGDHCEIELVMDDDDGTEATSFKIGYIFHQLK